MPWVLGTLGTLWTWIGCADEAGLGDAAARPPHDTADTPTDDADDADDTADTADPEATEPDPAALGVCTPTEPFPLEDGLPQGNYAGIGQREGSPTTFPLSAAITGDLLLMEGLVDGLSWITSDRFDLDADPVVWIGPSGPVGTCTLGDGVLDCTIDAGQPVQGTRRLTFSADCLWVDQVYTAGGVTERSWFELARIE